MASAVLMPVEEYLATFWEPDREYVDGVVIERNVGEHDHSFLQSAIAAVLREQAKRAGIRAFTEQRLEVAPKRYRLPDVCAMKKPYTREGVLKQPPHVCVEILSPDDAPGETLRKVGEYLQFGVPHVWIVDPRKRAAFHCDARGVHEVHDLILRAQDPDLAVDLNALFRELDED